MRSLLPDGTLDPAGMFDWDERRPPYPGLLAFQEQDAAIYFGRDAAILQSIETLNRLRHFGGARLALLLGGLGVAILSTPRGVMTGGEARKQNVGGELLCFVW